MASAAALALLSACAKSDGQRSLFGGTSATATYAQASQQTAPEPANPLHRATAYWAEQHRKNPRDADAALNYARNLKALGANGRALQIMEIAHRHNPSDARIASEYGRLALEAEDLPLARRLLTQAERSSRRPDWRLLSAQGALHAKLGENDTAQRYFQAALKQNPNSVSIMNNLAMSYVLDGQADRAEALLRRAIAQGGDNPRLRQNLALVIGLQGRFDEGQQIARADLTADLADANMAYLRDMVRAPAAQTGGAGQRQTQHGGTPASPASPAAAHGLRGTSSSDWTAAVAQESGGRR